MLGFTRMPYSILQGMEAALGFNAAEAVVAMCSELHRVDLKKTLSTVYSFPTLYNQGYEVNRIGYQLTQFGHIRCDFSYQVYHIDLMAPPDVVKVQFREIVDKLCDNHIEYILFGHHTRAYGIMTAGESTLEIEKSERRKKGIDLLTKPLHSTKQTEEL
jgi:hypothetical protein